MKTNKWLHDAPTKEGYYWFYGDFLGSMGIDFRDDAPKIEPKIHFVEIRKISNGILAVTEGRFVPLNKFSKKDKRQREGYVGFWMKVDLPTPPANTTSLWEKGSYD